MGAKFFVENIKNHCTDAKGISGEFVGRQRCVEWVLEPMSFVLSHLRFCVLRPVLLDVAWAGIPLVHNSPVLRELGFGLQNTFYSGNHVDDACNCFQRMEQDMVTMKGIFAPDALEGIRAALTERFSPLSPQVQGSYASLIDSVLHKTGLWNLFLFLFRCLRRHRSSSVSDSATCGRTSIPSIISLHFCSRPRARARYPGDRWSSNPYRFRSGVWALWRHMEEPACDPAKGPFHRREHAARRGCGPQPRLSAQGHGR